MSFRSRVVSVSAAASVILACGLVAVAQETSALVVFDGPGIKTDWNERVLMRGTSGPAVRTAHQWSPRRAQLNDVRNVEVMLSADPPIQGQSLLLEEPPLDFRSDPFTLMSEDEGYLTASPAASCVSCGGDGCGSTCASGGACHAGCGACLALVQCVAQQWLSSVDMFAGVQGFKGPVDLGANGNFGFHEGFNYGGPLGDPWGLGFQAGVQAVHSNFSGNQVVGLDSSGRDQVFFTGGVFRRAPCGGFQWGVAYDYLHDTYFDVSDLGQFRTELSYLRVNHREIGFLGSFGGHDDRLLFIQGGNPTENELESLDVYALFYRRHFTGGGQGRFWAGATADGDAILGADCSVPLGTSWALENAFTYVLPKEGGVNGQDQETWAVAMQLVWYPGRQASCLRANPFRPFFSVADNGTMITQRNP